MSLVITTHFCVCICFLNLEHTNFYSELGDGRIYCLTFSILRVLVSCLRLLFSRILLPQQHDHLPQACNVHVCIDIDIYTHIHAPCIAPGVCCALAAMLCAGFCWTAQRCCQSYVLPQSPSGSPSLSTLTAAHLHAPYSSLLDILLWQLQGFRRIHTLKIRLSAWFCFSLEDPSKKSAQFCSMLSLQASPL